MKKFALWTLVVCILMSMGIVCTTAVAEGDVYYLDSAGWPSRHWEYMNDSLIAEYEAEGWERYTGVLWYDKDWHAADFQNVAVSDIKELYDEGYTFHVIYSWICPADVLNKNGEQSVYVGRWILSSDQAIEYHKTYVKPEIPSELPNDVDAVFISQFYYNNMACELDGTESEEVLENVEFIRHQFDNYHFGKGSELFLNSGENESYDYEAVLEILENAGGFFNEMPAWN